MKTISKILSRLTLALSAGLLWGSLLPAAAQYASPVGTWDCVISGRENGVAYLTFNGDYTFTGYEVLARKSAGTQTNENVRGGDDIGRSVESSVSGGKTNFSGFALISGYWSHDVTGKKILGFYTEGNNSESCTTNQTVTESTTVEVVDNGDGTYTTNLSTFFVTNDVRTCEIVGLTNGLSFTAIVRPGVRISLKATSINGNKSLKCVPATEIADLSGNYYGEGKQAGLNFTEFLGLEASGEYPNAFDVVGLGAGYELEGIALASRQKKFGLMYQRSREDDPLFSVSGSINYSTLKTSLKGFNRNGQKLAYKMTPQFFPD